MLPEYLTAEVVNSLHSRVAGGHLGEQKTLEQLQESFYWPGHTEDVHKWCQQCQQCAQRKTLAPKNKAKLTSISPRLPTAASSNGYPGATATKPPQELICPSG